MRKRAGQHPVIAVIGAGPAGLMAAEVLAGAGHRVAVYERMASPARKLLMAGRGGLNLTHSEPLEAFLGRYHPRETLIEQAVRAFPPEELVAWAHGLGQETFRGSSGRVFPRALKASPLLRAWLRRLARLDVTLHTRHTWTGWTPEGALAFAGPDGRPLSIAPEATLLALGGASWPRLGADGAWVPLLREAGIEAGPLEPSNAGVRVAWSELIRRRFQGAPLKRIAVTLGETTRRGEAVITSEGLEGGVIYALSPLVRAASGPVVISIDLRPDQTLEDLERRLSAPRGKQSASTFLHKTLALAPVAIALLNEARAGKLPAAPAELARLIKGVPLPVSGLAGLERAISSAGGVRREELDPRFMLVKRPGVFVAGEMLDWDAPTGGYLLQASFATGRAAALGLIAWLDSQPHPVAG